MITFRVTPDEGEAYEVTATARDVLVWEKTGRNRVFSRFEDEQSMTDLYSIAHIASRRQQLFGGPLAEFETTCEVEPIGGDEDQEPDPTRPDHSRDG